MGLQNNLVILDSHNLEWQKIFKSEKLILKSIFDDSAVRIEHVGSTAINGISAKPIIDIAVGVKTLNLSKSIIKRLEEAGYIKIQGHGDVDRIFFAKGSRENRTHHLHVELYNGISWNNHILFRDYLNSNKEKIIEYETLKKELAAKYYNDRDKYTLGKASFIISVIEMCKREKENRNVNKSSVL